jgi:hypothetical protein
MFAKVAFASGLALLALTGAAQASSKIDNLPSWDGTSFISTFGGANTGVYGETFTAPTDPLHSFTFEVDDQGAPLHGIVAEVFAWSGSLTGGAGPQGATGAPLFTSAPFNINGVNGFQAITAWTGQVTLTPGDNYVILFVDTGSDNVQGLFGIEGHGNAVGDGGFNFFNNDHTLGTVSGTWDDFFDFGSLAFSASFGAPEPATWALMMLGVGGIGFALRRRKESARIAG